MDKRLNHELYISTNPRICLFSQRNLHRAVFRCGHYEFEDVICEVDDVDLLAPGSNRLFATGQKLVNRLAQSSSVAGFLNPGLERLRLNKSYDLFIASFQFPSDLVSLNAIKGWRRRCRTAVCWLSEVWTCELHRLEGQLRILSKFDYVLTNCSATVKPIQDAIQKPCFYVPPGIDTIRFCPYPNPPYRCIDVYYLGRKSPAIHHSLLKMAEQKQIFYIYDTIQKMDTLYYRQHRNLLANMAKRSRYFVAHPGKIDRTFETQGQDEIGFRFFEGTASGTVMIGDHPENKTYQKLFDWPNAVIRVPLDTPNIAELLTDLDSQPERIAEIRTNNVVQSLLRHDWVYRWRTILDIVGLKPKCALVAREQHLQRLARDIRKAHNGIIPVQSTKLIPSDTFERGCSDTPVA